MGYSGPEIYRRMNANPATTESMDAAQVASHELKVVHENLVGALQRIQGTMDGFWEGDAAAKANTGMMPLIATSEEAAANLDSTKNALYDQNGVFHEVRGKLRPMSESRPDASGPGDFLSIGASDAEVAAAKWDDDNRHNIRQYDGYAQGTDTNRALVVKQYPAMDTQVSGITTAATTGSGPITQPGDTHDPGGSGRHSGGIPGPSSGSGGYNAPAGYNQAPAGGHPPAPQSPPAPQPPPAQQPPAANWQQPQPTAPSQSTGASGYAPPSAPPPNGYGPGYGHSTGFGPTGGQPGNSYHSGSGFGPTGGGGGGGGGGYTGGGFGPRGSGGAPGAPAGGQPPASGRSTGSAPHTPSGQPAPRTGPTSGTSSSGSTGRGGMPMGGGGKGNGGEDETHERKFILPNDDPDDLFGGLPPGSKTVPPVIGE